MAKVSIERLREVLAYNPSSGELLWKVRNSNRATQGSRAGCSTRGRRTVIRVDGELLGAHRVAWAIHYGQWPEHVIDHINGDASDNRIENLRDIPQAGNMQNLRRARCDSQSGLIGAERDRTRWVSKIRLDGAKYYLGSFATAAEAHAAYVKAKRELHPFGTL